MSGWRQQTTEQAIQLETAKAHGVAVGLTQDQAGEVIDLWTDWYHGVGLAPDYRRTRSMMTNRAVGEPWRPPTATITEIAVPFASAMGIPLIQAATTIETAMRAAGERQQS